MIVAVPETYKQKMESIRWCPCSIAKASERNTIPFAQSQRLISGEQ